MREKPDALPEIRFFAKGRVSPYFSSSSVPPLLGCVHCSTERSGYLLLSCSNRNPFPILPHSNFLPYMLDNSGGTRREYPLSLTAGVRCAAPLLWRFHPPAAPFTSPHNHTGSRPMRAAAGVSSYCQRSFVGPHFFPGPGIGPKPKGMPTSLSSEKRKRSPSSR